MTGMSLRLGTELGRYGLFVHGKRASMHSHDAQVSAAALVSGLGLGAGAAFLFDPAQGKERRARIREKLVAAGHELSDAVSKGAHELHLYAGGTEGEGSPHGEQGAAAGGQIQGEEQGQLPLLQSFPPAARLVVGAAGIWLGSMGLRRHGFGGAVAKALAGGLLAWAAANRPISRLFSGASGASGVCGVCGEGSPSSSDVERRDGEQGATSGSPTQSSGSAQRAEFGNEGPAPNVGGREPEGVNEGWTLEGSDRSPGSGSAFGPSGRR